MSSENARKITLPSKDNEIIPWMDKREIPAIKMILSAWREKRKDWNAYGFCSELHGCTHEVAEENADKAAHCCEIIAQIDEALRKSK